MNGKCLVVVDAKLCHENKMNRSNLAISSGKLDGNGGKQWRQ